MTARSSDPNRSLLARYPAWTRALVIFVVVAGLGALYYRAVSSGDTTAIEEYTAGLVVGLGGIVVALRRRP